MHEPANLVGLSLLVLAVVAASDEAMASPSVPPDMEAALDLQLLSFDTNLIAKPGTDVVIAVVRDSSDTESIKQAAAIRAAFAQLGKRAKVKTKTVSISDLPYVAATFASDLSTAKADAIYVCGLDASIAAIAGVARARGAPSLTDVRHALDQGLAIGVIPSDAKPKQTDSDVGVIHARWKIVINLTAVKASRIKLDPTLLRIAEIIEP